ncbi:TOBE domain-containing protein [Streptomyces kunmingensis]|uniref:TOBE domain-containing protein n=1 Tax=Streptomyces kunmingensis TaxID=68225 RepID=A0ABU6CD79_9ACTN|nr:TOBE domain-containing protein [Streptomyces kunmingensis]MEB3962662.1 TOBE domain-containing protein [Streptomyces kunmingensis]
MHRITVTGRADRPSDDAINVLRAEVKQCSYTGARYEYELAVDDLLVTAESPVRHEDAEVNLLIRAEDCLVYPAA